MSVVDDQGAREPHPSTLVPLPRMESALREAFKALDEHNLARWATEINDDTADCAMEA